MEFSVIVPMFNSSNTIIATLNSIKYQTFRGFEIIVIDDGSWDNSLELVSDFAQKNENLNMKIISQENKGVSAARNSGIRIANGNWIAFLDSDDEWLPNKLEMQFQILNGNQNIDFLGTNRNNEHFSWFFFKRFERLTRIEAKTLLFKSFFLTPTVIFRRNLISDIGLFDETIRYCEDRNYFLNICKKYNCYLLNESLVITGAGKAHYGDKGLSGDLWKMQKGELHNIEHALKLGIINNFEFTYIFFYSMFKYVIRLSISNVRKIKRRFL